MKNEIITITNVSNNLHNGAPKEIEVLRAKPVMCKTCGDYERRIGSAYCQHCAEKYKNEKSNI